MCDFPWCKQGVPFKNRQTGVEKRTEGWIFHVIFKAIFEKIE